jgi:hypothetical protein
MNRILLTLEIADNAAMQRIFAMHYLRFLLFLPIKLRLDNRIGMYGGVHACALFSKAL